MTISETDREIIETEFIFDATDRLDECGLGESDAKPEIKDESATAQKESNQ